MQSLIASLFAMEANNDQKFDGLPAPTNVPRLDRQNTTATSNLDNDKPSPLPRQHYDNVDNIAPYQ